MSDFPYDPTTGTIHHSNTPYQYWKGSEPKEAGGKVEFVINQIVYTVNIEADGSWEFSLPTRLMDGQHNLSIRYIDRALNYGPPIQSTINVDTTPPAKPIIQAVLDDVGDKMPLSNGQITDDTKPRFSGSAEPQSIVRLFDKNTGALLGSAVANANGYWTIEEELGYGQREVFVTSSDRHNQASEPSESWVVNIKDPNVPPASDPYITGGADNVGAAQGELAFGAVTDDNRPTLKGMAEPGSIVWLFVKKAADQWLILGSTRAESNGSWSMETAQLNAGQYDFQVGSSDVRNPAADIFRLTIADAGSDALKPVIVDAFDDVGAATGALANGAVTDDRNPTLRGTAEPNSIVYLFAKGGAAGKWVLFASIKAGPAGDWQWNYGSDMSRLEYQFQVGSVPERDVNGDIFRLTIADAGSSALKPVIVDAYDDSGAVTGALANGAVTDDRTPTLRGTAEANSIVYIRFSRSNVDWEPVASVKANAKGEWTFTPELYQNHVWDFYVGSSPTTFDYANRFQLNVKSNLIDSRTVWDFNDGTLQGWTAAGKYAQSGQLLVKKWSASGNSNEVGSYTNGNGDGFAGNVVYRDITVIKGQVYQFSFDVVRLNGSYTAPKLGMTVDGQTVIAQADVGQSWQNRSGTYIANETKTVRVAVTNGQNSGSGNDFAFDNIVINPVGNINNGITDKFNNITAGEYSSLTTDLFSVTNYAKKIKVGSIYNLGDGSTIIKPEGQGADFRFTLKNGAKANSLEFDLFNYQPAAYSKKQYIVLKLYLGSQLVETKTLILADVHGLHKVTTSGKEFDGFTLVQPSSSDNWSIDNVKVQSTPVSSSRGFLQEDSVLFELDDQQSVLLLSDALEGTVQKGVDLNGHGSTTLTVTAGDVLAFGEKDLFIADGRTQLMINGDASDVVNLDELLGDSQDWSQLTGTMTVGGVEYNVWQHSGEDAELLIQSGVQTQLN